MLLRVAYLLLIFCPGIHVGNAFLWVHCMDISSTSLPMESLIENRDTTVNGNLANVSAQQKARILYDFALNGEDYCLLQRFWDEHDKNNSNSKAYLGYNIRPKKSDIVLLKEQLFRIGIRDPPSGDQASNYDPKAPYLETSTVGPTRDVLLTMNGSSSVGNQSTVDKNFPTDPVPPAQNITIQDSDIDHSQQNESKLTQFEKGYLLRTIISSNYRSPDEHDRKKENKNNTVNSSEFTELKKIGLRRIGLFYKRLSDNMSLKEHQSINLDYDESSNLGSLSKDNKEKVVYYDQGKTFSNSSLQNITMKLFNVFHYEFQEQVHFIYWLIDRASNGTKRFISYDEAILAIENNLSKMEINKIFSDLNILKLLEPYKEGATKNDNDDSMSFLQTYLPKAQSLLNSWEVYIISAIFLILLLILILSLIVLCCRSATNKQLDTENESTQFHSDRLQDRGGKPGNLEQSSTYLSFSQETSDKEDAIIDIRKPDQISAKSIWTKVSQHDNNFAQSDDTNSKFIETKTTSFKQNDAGQLPSNFEWYSFEGKRIDNTDAKKVQKFSLKKLNKQQTKESRELFNDEEPRSDNYQNQTGKFNTRSKQILWAQDLLQMQRERQIEEDANDLKYRDLVKEQTVQSTFSRRGAPKTKYDDNDDDQTNSEISQKTSELVMMKQKLVPIVKQATSISDYKNNLTDEPIQHHANRPSSRIQNHHEYVNLTEKIGINQAPMVPQRRNLPGSRLDSRCSVTKDNHSFKSNKSFDYKNNNLLHEGHRSANSRSFDDVDTSDMDRSQPHNCRLAKSDKMSNIHEIHKSCSYGVSRPREEDNCIPNEIIRPSTSSGSIQVIQGSTTNIDDPTKATEIAEDDNRRPTIIHIELSGRTQSMVDQIRDELTKIEGRDIPAVRSIPTQSETKKSRGVDSANIGPPMNLTSDRSLISNVEMHYFDDHSLSSSEV